MIDASKFRAIQRSERVKEMAFYYYDISLPLREVGAIFGVSGQRVQQILIENGYQLRGKGKPARSPRIKTCLVCGKKYEHGSFQEHSKRENHKQSTRVEENQGRNSQMLREYFDSGLTTAKISEKYGVPQPYIYRILKYRGLKPNRQNGSGRYVRTPEQKAAGAARLRAGWLRWRAEQQRILNPNGETPT